MVNLIDKNKTKNSYFSPTISPSKNQNLLPNIIELKVGATERNSLDK